MRNDIEKFIKTNNETAKFIVLNVLYMKLWVCNN